MFRRFRRPRPGRRVPLPARRRLQRAHGLMMAGRFAEAAELFADLARRAAARGLPQAPHLALKAAEAYFKADQTEAALHWLTRGLRQLANAGRWAALRRAGERAIALAQGRGRADLVAVVRAQLARWLEQAPEPPAGPSRPAGVGLPARCDACGAPALPDEVVWQQGVPVCAYCGTPLMRTV